MDGASPRAEATLIFFGLPALIDEPLRPLRVKLDKTQGEHNPSAFERIATKPPLAQGSLKLAAKPWFKLLTKGAERCAMNSPTRNGLPSSRCCLISRAV